MDQRRQDEHRIDRARETGSGGYDEGQRGMGGGDVGDLQGYVVPYRYYGPGYRGLGYYAVFYQGSDRESEQGGIDDQSRWTSQGTTPSRGFAGRGPKGYQRSDERLKDEVCDRLMADDGVDAREIDVQVEGGEVTLAGTVPDRWMKRRAEDLAERVMGVREVMNQLRAAGDQQTGADADDRPNRSTETGRSKATRAVPLGGNEEPLPNGRRAAASGSR